MDPGARQRDTALNVVRDAALSGRGERHGNGLAQIGQQSLHLQHTLAQPIQFLAVAAGHMFGAHHHELTVAEDAAQGLGEFTYNGARHAQRRLILQGQALQRRGSPLLRAARLPPALASDGQHKTNDQTQNGQGHNIEPIDGRAYVTQRETL